jgi:hypothetical protein
MGYIESSANHRRGSTQGTYRHQPDGGVSVTRLERIAVTIACDQLDSTLGQPLTSPRAAPAWVHGLSRAAGLIAGPWFLAITIYLLTNAVAPLTGNAGWAAPPTSSRSAPTWPA